MQDYSTLRITKINNQDFIQAQSPDGEWWTCKNQDREDDIEDIRQYHSILPKFKHAYLSENFDL